MYGAKKNRIMYKKILVTTLKRKTESRSVFFSSFLLTSAAVSPLSCMVVAKVTNKSISPSKVDKLVSMIKNNKVPRDIDRMV